MPYNLYYINGFSDLLQVTEKFGVGRSLRELPEFAVGKLADLRNINLIYYKESPMKARYLEQAAIALKHCK